MQHLDRSDLADQRAQLAHLLVVCKLADPDFKRVHVKEADSNQIAVLLKGKHKPRFVALF